MGKVRGRPFPPGNRFGQGRPKGSKNQATLLVQKLLGDHAESITRKVVIQALQGDRHAQRLCLERLSAPQRNVPLRMHLGPTKTAAEVDVASQRVLRAVAHGSIPPADGEILANILELRRRAIESAEFEARLAKLEREADAEGPSAA